VVGGEEGRAELFDNFLAVWESFSPGRIEAEIVRRRVAAAVTGGVEFDRLVWRVRLTGLLPRLPSSSMIKPESCLGLRGNSGVGGITSLDLSEPRESDF
jgi:hypothetical protein